jgi:hypothetical protein
MLFPVACIIFGCKSKRLLAEIAVAIWFLIKTAEPWVGSRQGSAFTNGLDLHPFYWVPIKNGRNDFSSVLNAAWISSRSLFLASGIIPSRLI